MNVARTICAGVGVQPDQLPEATAATRQSWAAAAPGEHEQRDAHFRAELWARGRRLRGQVAGIAPNKT